jgi:hypothetical protein
MVRAHPNSVGPSGNLNVRSGSMLSKKACDLRRTVIPLVPRLTASEAGHDGAAGR